MRWRWPWSEVEKTADPDHAVTAGKKSVQEAHNGYLRALSLWPDVLDVSGSLRELRERNHFSERIAAIYAADDQRKEDE